MTDDSTSHSGQVEGTPEVPADVTAVVEAAATAVSEAVPVAAPVAEAVATAVAEAIPAASAVPTGVVLPFPEVPGLSHKVSKATVVKVSSQVLTLAAAFTVARLGVDLSSVDSSLVAVALSYVAAGIADELTKELPQDISVS